MSRQNSKRAKWACRLCTFLNHAKLPWCEVCESPVAEAEPIPAPTSTGGDIGGVGVGSTTTSVATAPDMDLSQVPHVTYHERQLQSSVEISDRWASSSFVCPEFRGASDMICVRRELMSSSILQRIFTFIDQHLVTHPLSGSFEEQVLRAICKAYKLKDVSQARYQQCALGGYSLYHSVLELASSMGWRRRYLHAAIRDLTDIEDETGLMSILSLLARGGAECQARRLMAFSTVIQRMEQALTNANRAAAQEYLLSTSGLPPTATAAATATATATGATGDADTDAVENERALNAAKQTLYDFMLNYLDDYKRKAFKTAFIEPTRLYFDCIRDSIMRDDAEVHGSNTYACVLLACLGIRLPLTPLFEDEVKGCCNFLAARSLQPLYDRLMAKDYFGWDWETVRGCAPPAHQRMFKRDYATNRSFCVMYAQTPFDVANNAIAPDNHAVRCEIALYLERFASLFTADLFLERAFLAIMQHDDLLKPLAAVLAHFQQLEREKQARQQQGQALDDGSEIDSCLLEATHLRDWLYDQEEFTFVVSRAIRVFAFLDIAKQP